MNKAEQIQESNNKLKQEHIKLKSENLRLKDYIDKTFEYVSILFDFSKERLRNLVNDFISKFNIKDR